jgi:hypothetical protein
MGKIPIAEFRLKAGRDHPDCSQSRRALYCFGWSLPETKAI